MTESPTALTDSISRPWDDLAATGLLWLINATVFHPRGVTLALALDGSGWDLYRVGTVHPHPVLGTAERESRATALATIAQVRRPVIPILVDVLASTDQ